MSPELKHIARILEFNTVNLRLCVQDITQEQANKRVLGGNPNSLSYVVGHMINGRFNMLKLAGVADAAEWQARFGFDDSGDQGAGYPTIDEIRKTWDDVAEKVLGAMKSLSDEQATAEIPTGFPMQEKTVAGGLAFWTWHDSYHLGNVGSIRTSLGLKPMKDVFHQAMDK